ncbi:SDR family oxidoreductase, partial [Candidatus Hydrogenedentota bacterium]
ATPCVQGPLTCSCRGVDAIINIAYISLAHNVIAAARKCGVSRAVFLGSTGVYTELPSKSAQAKRDAEAEIGRSGLDFTILRATMIYGSDLDRNISRLIRYVNRCPVFPVFGRGESLVQPVHVDNVVGSVVDVLDKPTTFGKSYDIGGRSSMSYVELVRNTSKGLGRRVWRLSIPMWLAVAGVSIAGRFINLSREQALRLNEDKNVDISPACGDFGYNPIEFSEGVAREIAILREKGLI